MKSTGQDITSRKVEERNQNGADGSDANSQNLITKVGKNGNTNKLWLSCAKGNSVSCNNLKAVNKKDFDTALEFIRKDSPHLLEDFSEYETGFSNTKNFQPWAVGGDTDPATLDIRLSRAYPSLEKFVETTWHELKHRYDGRAKLIMINTQDSLFPNSETGRGSLHQQVHDDAAKFKTRYLDSLN